jgi:hypothetical protein
MQALTRINATKIKLALTMSTRGNARGDLPALGLPFTVVMSLRQNGVTESAMAPCRQQMTL